ncbi:hypothetical protein L5515_016449 [Caenorhabditis briggsae]|uniref:Uncharacterized protein n=1 Tax=Caenorhabditis briggsae TaxID=6238 RepID=A0AAE9F6N0_CAEBR|nr:hypothetical protein L5515_016449 [Caenorhabditis briggsae]
MNAQVDHLWDSQFEQFLAPEDRVDAPYGSAMHPSIYSSFQDAVRIAREEFPTLFIADCRDLSVYLINENGKEELPQFKMQLISA